MFRYGARLWCPKIKFQIVEFPMLQTLCLILEQKNFILFFFTIPCYQAPAQNIKQNMISKLYEIKILIKWKTGRSRSRWSYHLIPNILLTSSQGGRGWRGKITDIWWHVSHCHTGAGSGRETPETSHTVTPYTMLSCPLVRSHYKHHHNRPHSSVVLSMEMIETKHGTQHTLGWF